MSRIQGRAALRAADRESERQPTQSVATLWWALDPDVLAESRVLAETLGIADENLLLGDWASRSRFRRLASWLTFSRETLGWQMPLVHSPAQCKPGILVRCLSICDPNDAQPLVEFVEYSLPTSMDSKCSVDSKCWHCVHRLKEYAALKALHAQLLESLRAMDASDSEQGGPTQLQCDKRAERKRAQQLDEQSRRKRAMMERAARNPAGREFERNMAAIASMGLPPLAPDTSDR